MTATPVPAPATTCPHCKNLIKQPNRLITLTENNAAQLVWRGCVDCLVSNAKEFAIRNTATCHLCGAEKKPTFFANTQERLECPIHVHARGLLGQCLQILRPLVQVKGVPPDLPMLCTRLTEILGVKE